MWLEYDAIMGSERDTAILRWSLQPREWSREHGEGRLSTLSSTEAKKTPFIARCAALSCNPAVSDSPATGAFWPTTLDVQDRGQSNVLRSMRGVADAKCGKVFLFLYFYFYFYFVFIFILFLLLFSIIFQVKEQKGTTIRLDLSV